MTEMNPRDKVYMELLALQRKVSDLHYEKLEAFNALREFANKNYNAVEYVDDEAVLNDNIYDIAPLRFKIQGVGHIMPAVNGVLYCYFKDIIEEIEDYGGLHLYAEFVCTVQNGVSVKVEDLDQDRLVDENVSLKLGLPDIRLIEQHRIIKDQTDLPKPTNYPELPDFTEEELEQIKLHEERKKKRAQNLSEPIHVGNFDKFKKTIHDMRSSEDFKEGSLILLEKKSEDENAPCIAVYKDYVEFMLGDTIDFLIDDDNPFGFAVQPFFSLDDFEEESIKYIGEKAVDYALAYSPSLNTDKALASRVLDIDGLFIDGLQFKDEELYEFLTLVNEFGHFHFE